MTDTEARFVLGLPPAFSPRDLKHAYRRAAAANHPDHGGRTERMVLVNEAYAALSGEPAVSAASPPPPDARTWSEADAEAFRRETGHAPSRRDHPLEPFVRGVSGALAIVAWLAGIVDSIDKPSQLGSWVLVGLLLSYFLISTLVRFVVRCGIHAWNAGIGVYDRIGTLNS